LGFADRFKKHPGALSVQTDRERGHPFGALEAYLPLKGSDYRLYESLREGVPIIDAAIDRLVRLVGSFSLTSQDPAVARELSRLKEEILVSGCQQGMDSFLASYLDSLLTYGNAAGEMVLSPGGRSLAALYNAPLENIQVRWEENPLNLSFYASTGGLGFAPVPYPELILFSSLKPKPGQVRGESILKGLPFVTDILLKIYRSVGNNFDRVANLRYAVTYRPGASQLDRAYAKEIAQNIAGEWSAAMSAAQNGQVRDFVAVGDVDIKVIGADNQMIDTQVPVRQLLEQIVAKLGIPPFILGLHWSSTERMSSQQADILTSELDYYRGLLTPVIRKICATHLCLSGLSGAFAVEWESVNLQDEVELANARLLRLQGDQIKQTMEGKE